jgi:hypothetical protein
MDIDICILYPNIDAKSTQTILKFMFTFICFHSTVISLHFYFRLLYFINYSLRLPSCVLTNHFMFLFENFPRYIISIGYFDANIICILGFRKTCKFTSFRPSVGTIWLSNKNRLVSTDTNLTLKRNQFYSLVISMRTILSRY